MMRDAWSASGGNHMVNKPGFAAKVEAHSGMHGEKRAFRVIRGLLLLITADMTVRVLGAALSVLYARTGLPGGELLLLPLLGLMFLSGFTMGRKAARMKGEDGR